MKRSNLFLVALMASVSFAASAETATQTEAQVEQKTQTQLKQTIQQQQRVGPEVPNVDHVQKKNQYQHQNKHLYKKEGQVVGKGLKSERSEVRPDNRANGGMSGVRQGGGGKH